MKIFPCIDSILKIRCIEISFVNQRETMKSFGCSIKKQSPDLFHNFYSFSTLYPVLSPASFWRIVTDSRQVGVVSSFLDSHLISRSVSGFRCSQWLGATRHWGKTPAKKDRFLLVERYGTKSKGLRQSSWNSDVRTELRCNSSVFSAHRSRVRLFLSSANSYVESPTFRELCWGTYVDCIVTVNNLFPSPISPLLRGTSIRFHGTQEVVNVFTYRNLPFQQFKSSVSLNPVTLGLFSAVLVKTVVRLRSKCKLSAWEFTRTRIFEISQRNENRFLSRTIYRHRVVRDQSVPLVSR